MRVPIRSLELNQILGQPYAFQVEGQLHKDFLSPPGSIWSLNKGAEN
jgi:hypothetical protein